MADENRRKADSPEVSVSSAEIPASASTTATMEPSDPPEPESKEIVGRSPGQLAWLRLKRDRTARVTGTIIIIILAMGFGAPVISRLYGQGMRQSNMDKLDGTGIPLGFAGVSGEHWLGITPGRGYDVFVELLFGIRTSLTIALISAVVVTAIGAIVGATSAYLGGWVDAVVAWVIDLVLSLPFLIFAIALVPIVMQVMFGGPVERPLWLSVTLLLTIFTLFYWTSSARLVRGQVKSLREREFVEAARAAGAGTWHIVFKQLLPNVWAPILVSFSLAVPALVMAEAYLSFLGAGVDGDPVLGQLVNLAMSRMQQVNGWFLLVVSGSALFTIVLTFNLFGDSVRDALDPKSNK